jgi:hypothetical protein
LRQRRWCGPGGRWRRPRGRRSLRPDRGWPGRPRAPARSPSGRPARRPAPRTGAWGRWASEPHRGRGARAAPRRAPRRCGSPRATGPAGPGASRSSFLLDGIDRRGSNLDLPNGRRPTVRFRIGEPVSPPAARAGRPAVR